MKKLKILRKAAGLTQAQLAALSGVNRTCIIDIEKEDTNVTIKTLAKLAKALNCTIDELM